MSKKASTGEDVRKMTDEELGLELKRLRNELHTLRTQLVTSKVENTSGFRGTRRSIARILTETNARRHAKNPKPARPAPEARKPKSVKPVAQKAGAKRGARTAGKK